MNDSDFEAFLDKKIECTQRDVHNLRKFIATYIAFIETEMGDLPYLSYEELHRYYPFKSRSKESFEEMCKSVAHLFTYGSKLIDHKTNTEYILFHSFKCRHEAEGRYILTKGDKFGFARKYSLSIENI
jgi:hypothetical protein